MLRRVALLGRGSAAVYGTVSISVRTSSCSLKPNLNHCRMRCVYHDDPGDNEEEALEKISRERFIRLGTALGVGAACASLVACGGGASSSGGGSGDKNSGGGGDSGSKDSGGGGNYGGGGSGGKDPGGGSKKPSGGDAKAGGNAIASESEVAPGSALTFEDSGNPALLVHLDNGDFVAYSAVCTHQRCEVAYQDGNLACPCHGSVFDPADGAAVVAGPAPRPLPEIPVKVEGGEVVRA
jgi:nitrite reductase/ring-hydroxylating ferredoxin subunit